MSTVIKHHFVSSLQGIQNNNTFYLSRLHPDKNEFILVTITETELQEQIGDNGKDKFIPSVQILSHREVEAKVKEWCSENILSEEEGYQFLASL